MGKNKRQLAYKRAKDAQHEVTAANEAAPTLTASPSRVNPATAIEIAALLLLPLVAFWAMRFIPINQNHFLDPYIYTAYAHRFEDLVARYGLTYYSVRFGIIAPSRLFTDLFGPEGGYFMLRYVLAATAGIPLYYMVKRNFSQAIAALTVAGMLTSPYFARALLWDYPDAAGVPFLTAAICLFLLENRFSMWRDTFAGALAGMAVNSNFFEVAVIGIFGGIWLLFCVFFKRSLNDVIKRAAAVALGGLIICVLGCIYYWHALGKPTNIFQPTVAMASDLATGGTKQWHIAGMIWTFNSIHVFIPPLLVICCASVGRWRKVNFTSLVIVSFGLTVTTFYYAEQFFLDSDILQLFYYFSYLTPAIFLMLAFLWQALWERTSGGPVAFVGLGLAALLTPWVSAIWIGWPLPTLTASEWLALSGLLILMVSLATRKWRWPVLSGTLPWVALILLGVWFTGGQRYFSNMVRTGKVTDNSELDVYRVAFQFMDAVPKLADHPGVIRFWYNNRPGNSINSVQSTFLWGYSKINTNPPEDPGLPHLGEFQLKLLRDPEVRYLGLLCESEDELSQGLTALRMDSIEYKLADYRVLSSGNYRVYYQLVELIHRASTPPA